MPRIVGNRCFASDTINGLFVVDISNLKQPKILGNLVLPKTDPENPNIGIPYKQIQDPTIPQGDSISSIAIGDGVLYMSGSYTGIYLAEFPDQARLEPKDRGALPKLPAQPYQGESTAHFHSSGPELSNPTRGVALHGDIAYTANVWDGLKIYQLSENAVKQIGKVDIAYAADVKRSGDRLYVAEGQNGIGVYQIKSPTKVSEIGRLDVLETPLNFVQFLWAFDGSDTIAATCAGTKVSFINFADPAKPEIIHSTSGSQLLYGSYGSQHLVKDRYFAIARHCGGLMAFDLKSNPVKDLWYDTFPLCSQTGGVAAFGDKLLVMRAGGYAFFDPEHPVSTKELTRNKFPGQVQLPDDVPDDSAISRALFPKTEWEGLPNYDSNSRKLAIVNRMFKNLHIYDFTDPAHPKLLKRIPLSSNVYPPVFWQGRVVLPGGYSGLLLEKE
jgi:hypothetical protein